MYTVESEYNVVNHNPSLVHIAIDFLLCNEYLRISIGEIDLPWANTQRLLKRYM